MYQPTTLGELTMHLSSFSDTVAENVQTLGTGDDMEFTIGDASLIMRMLSDNYSNLLRVVPQEYLCNARDAHREIGKHDTPIKVTLPTRFEPTLTIRDYGPSLSPERIKNVFTVFGKSTKRGSNNETGGFGIGAKCGFAYNNAFTVRAITEGILRVYAMTINEAGKPTCTPMGEVETDQPDGSEIIIPIKTDDINSIEYWTKHCVQYWDVKPEFTNLTSPIDNGIDQEGEGWVADKEQACPFVILDGVQYPIDHSLLRDYGTDLYNINHIGVGFVFNTGDVKPAPNRETLVYTDEVKQTIQQRASDVIKQFQERMTEEVQKAKDLPEAYQIFGELNDVIGKGIVDHVVWNDYKVNRYSFSLDGYPRIYTYRGASTRPEKGSGSLNLRAKDTLILFNDEDNVRPSKARIDQIFDTTEYKSVQVIHIMEHTDKGELEKELEKLKKVMHIGKMTDYEKMKRTYARGSRKATTTVYALDNSQWTTGRDAWSPAEVDIKSGQQVVYVEYSRGAVEGTTLTAIEIKDIIRTYELDITVYGVPTRYIGKFETADNCITIDEFAVNLYNEKLTEHADDLNEDGELFSELSYAQLYSYNDCFSYSTRSVIEQLNKLGHAFDALEEYKQFSDSVACVKIPEHIKVLRNLARMLGKADPYTIAETSDSKLKAYYDTFRDLMPILSHVSSYHMESADDAITKDVAEYVTNKLESLTA